MDNVWTQDCKYLMKSYDLDLGKSGEWKTISSGAMLCETKVSKYLGFGLPYTCPLSTFSIADLITNVFIPVCRLTPMAKRYDTSYPK